MTGKSELRVGPLLRAAAILGGALLALTYAVIAVVWPLTTSSAASPQYTSAEDIFFPVLAAATFVGALLGAAAGFISSICLARVRRDRSIARMLGAAIGPLVVSCVTYVALFQFSPGVLHLVAFGGAALVGTLGLVIVEKVLRTVSND
jgi:hypothetical protein